MHLSSKWVDGLVRHAVQSIYGNEQTRCPTFPMIHHGYFKGREYGCKRQIATVNTDHELLCECPDRTRLIHYDRGCRYSAASPDTTRNYRYVTCGLCRKQLRLG